MIARYSLTLRLLHWVTAALVAVQVSLALANIIFYEPRPVLAEALVQVHISSGALILALTLLRIVVRLTSQAPATSDRPLLNRAAKLTHVLLYACVLLLPVTGYLKLAALGFSITLGGLVALPALPLNIALAQRADAWHGAVALGLGCLLVLHVCAALFHPRLDGRAVLPHMAVPWRRS